MNNKEIVFQIFLHLQIPDFNSSIVNIYNEQEITIIFTLIKQSFVHLLKRPEKDTDIIDRIKRFTSC